MTGPNWAALYVAGRCKEIGIPWTEEEAVALANLDIPVEYVRDGILTTEEYQEVLKSDEKNGKPLNRLSRGEIEAKAKELEVEFAPQTPDSAIVRMIERALEKEGEKPKKKEKKEEKKEVKDNKK